LISEYLIELGGIHRNPWTTCHPKAFILDCNYNNHRFLTLIVQRPFSEHLICHISYCL
uniref:Uncharacterized protein n=1 Tax=Parascaris equorum TaxID=6256 RepID=A0A914RAW3_PAREQ